MSISLKIRSRLAVALLTLACITLSGAFGYMFIEGMTFLDSLYMTVITLSVRELRPDIAIHARAETDNGIRRLHLAGAAQVISPFHVGGMRIAQKILRPAVVDFIELSQSGAGESINLEEIALQEGCPIDGILIKELSQHDVRVLIVAVRRKDKSIKVHPGADDRLQGGDLVVLVGERDSLVRLAALAVRTTKGGR